MDFVSREYYGLKAGKVYVENGKWRLIPYTFIFEFLIITKKIQS